MSLLPTDTTAIRVLDAAIRTLRLDLKPRLTDDAEHLRVDHITRMLWLVRARLGVRAVGLRDFLASDAMDGADLDVSLQELELCFERSERAFSDGIPALLDAAAQSQQGVERIAALVEQRKQFYVSQDPDVAQGSQVAYRGGRILGEEKAAESVEAVVDDVSLTKYLQRRFAPARLRAEQVRLIPGGFSKITMFFTQVDEDSGERRELVLRRDMPYKFIDTTVAREFEPLKHLHALGFPVARPVFFEPDKSIFGGAFMASERVSGSSNVARWAKNKAMARVACVELAQFAARLHALDPRKLGYAEALAANSAGVHMERELARWLTLFRERRPSAMPMQELPLLWLMRNIPRELYARPARVVHADLGFHNMMFEDSGRLTAMLDWEFTVLGDPTQDLCFVRAFVEPFMPWNEWLSVYRQAGGAEPCAAAEFFFNLWSGVRNGIGCAIAQNLFDTDTPNEVRFALAGHVFAPYMYLEPCEALIRHLRQSPQ